MREARDAGAPAYSPLGLASGLVALAMGSALFSVAFGEVVLRALAPQPVSWLAIYRRHPSLPFPGLLPDIRVAVDTGETRWLVRTDRAGFRIGDSPRASARCTALWLGDSFAFGHGVDWEDSLVGLVEARVRAMRQANAAVPGYGPVQYRQVLEYLLGQGEEFRFIFVVTYVGNDFHDCLWNRDVRVQDGIIGHRGDLRSWLKSHLHLYRLASAAYHRLAPAPESPYQRTLDELADPQAWTSGTLARAEQIFVRELTRIRDLARAAGAEARFLILPTQEAVAAARGEKSEGTSRALLPVSRARSALDEIDAMVFDATGVLAADPAVRVYFPFDGHLDREGNRRVADGLLAAWSLDCSRARSGARGDHAGPPTAPTSGVAEVLQSPR